MLLFRTYSFFHNILALSKTYPIIKAILTLSSEQKKKKKKRNLSNCTTLKLGSPARNLDT